MSDLKARLLDIRESVSEYTDKSMCLRAWSPKKLKDLGQEAHDRIEELEERLATAMMDGHDLAKREYRDRIRELEAALVKIREYSLSNDFDGDYNIAFLCQAALGGDDG